MFTATRVVNVRHNVGKNGSHFVPLEGKFLLIALLIVRITEM
jgi:hypothetical protein